MIPVHPPVHQTDIDLVNALVESCAGSLSTCVAQLVAGGARRTDLAFLLELLPDGTLNVAGDVKDRVVDLYLRDPDKPELFKDGIRLSATADEPLLVVFVHEGLQRPDGMLGEGLTVSGVRLLTAECETRGGHQPIVVAMSPTLARCLKAAGRRETERSTQ